MVFSLWWFAIRAQTLNALDDPSGAAKVVLGIGDLDQTIEAPA
jgi:hypothetical protein